MNQSNDIKAILVFVFLLLRTSLFYAQDIQLKKVDSLLKIEKFLSAEKELKSIDTISLSEFQRAKRFFLFAEIYREKNVLDKSVNFYLRAKNQFLKLDSIDRAQQINLELFHLLSSENNLKDKANKFLDEYINYALKRDDPLLLAKGYERKAVSIIESNPEESLVFFRKALSTGSHLKNDEFAATLYNNIGVLFNEKLNNPDSALYYYNKNYALVKKRNSPKELVYAYFNKAGCYYYLNDYRKSLQLLNQADSLSALADNMEGYKSVIKLVKALNYEGLGDFEHAYKNMQAYDSIKKIKNEEDFELKTSEFLVQYEAQEKEIENLKLNARLQTNRILLFSTTAAILIIIFGAYFWIVNLRKKRKIAEQERLIERQRLEKELKDQEIQSIDMILESQEKERKKIADELHDSLGSLMVSLKYNFNYLTKNLSNEAELEVVSNTNKLLDDAYKQVRTISHLKNVGMQGNEGLIKALQNMISKMNVPNGIHFKLIPYGLNKKLDNQLEIFIFRIIQEMCTNVLKYAKATEVSIYLTQHGDHELNIMIEDDGAGFDSKKIKTKKGMGLRNIETRVEIMGGNFEIDSVIGNGTTITLNIPI
jgi:signal transduction histidine kinase